MGQKKARALPALTTTLVTPSDGSTPVLELDELWSFVHSKLWPAWVWLAVCRQTRQVVAWALGDRSEQTCRELWDAVPEPFRCATCYTDFWEAYRAVLPATQHEAVGKESGQTAHVERLNLTLRQRLGRLARKTLSFSKSDLMHAYCLELFLHDYNRSLASP